MKVILTDLESRKAFDIFNLVKHYCFDIKAYSNSSNGIELKILEFIYGNKIYTLDKENLFNSFKTLINDKSNNYIYFPVEEDTTVKFYELIKNYNISNFYYKLPPKKSFDCVRDKLKFSKYCLEHNFPVPLEYSYDDILKKNQLPCNLIIKPKSGSGSMGIKFVDTFEEFLSYKDLDFEQFIIQERLENSKDVEGAFFLFDNGKMVSYYGHKRIRTYPSEGGVTIYSKCEYNEVLKNIGKNLLESLNWSGIAMVEFILDKRDNSYKIIEVNPRAWGSIMLSEFSNANIIKNYLMICKGKESNICEVKEDRYIRWVFPWDIIYYLKNGGNIKSFLLLNSDNTCYINFSYTKKYKALLFLIYNILDYKKITKFIKKVFG